MNIKVEKPFASYKWHWASVTPTESLNSPPVFLGVLRAFNKFEGYSPGDEKVLEALATVQRETGTKVNLVRTSERNLLRNSGQYWKALGLLNDTHGKIEITSFGKLLACGEITKTEFAATVIKTFELPNEMIMSDADEWRRSSLKMRPLQLLVDILAELQIKHGSKESFITPKELIKMIIPLAGQKMAMRDIVDALLAHRSGKLSIEGWPDCAPASNDKRMAKEFLLFLENYGLCKKKSSEGKSENDQYCLLSIISRDIIDLERLPVKNRSLDEIVREIRESEITATIERKKISRQVLERPKQNIFRKNILKAYENKCIITGVCMETVLEASHIIPVPERGSDKIENGLCFRSDIHQLYDSGHLRIKHDGELLLSEPAARKENYASLPRRILLPKFVKRENLEWRLNYY